MVPPPPNPDGEQAIFHATAHLVRRTHEDDYVHAWTWAIIGIFLAMSVLFLVFLYINRKAHAKPKMVTSAMHRQAVKEGFNLHMDMQMKDYVPRG